MESINKTQDPLIQSGKSQVNIEFQDLTYSIPQAKKGPKLILRSINGTFRSGQLTAILGPSGAGKSTLLNILAGYRCIGSSGAVNVNGKPRNIKEFRKISRYIMQEDLLQPWLTIQECMMTAADLKLSRDVSKREKLTVINDILEMLRLSKARNTTTDRLSGGEKKRLSIALELVNNPPVLFLDEPTTGLDDLSCSQCISLLKLIAQGGRTVICSIHSPSARHFAMFDHVYIVSAGQCVYQGIGSDIVPFLQNVGLDCPTHYNPADFIIDVASGEYGHHMDKLVSLIDNGKRCYSSEKSQTSKKQTATTDEPKITYEPNTKSILSRNLSNECEISTWIQVKTLFHRMALQTFRDTKNLLIQTIMYLFIAIMVGALFYNLGHDAAMAFSNVCSIFSMLLVFMYCPLLPVLLNFPVQVQLLKREYFNRWYNLSAYFFAMTLVKLPVQLALGGACIGIVYLLTDQPLEWNRIIMFFTICTLIGLISEAIGLAISSTLNILHGMFVGPTMLAPLMLLSVYGYGNGNGEISFPIRMLMSISYLRYGMIGLIGAIYGEDRSKIPCPDYRDFCMYTSPQEIMVFHGFHNADFWFGLTVLIGFYVSVKAIGFYLLRQRLSPNKTFKALKTIGIFVKSKINISR